MGCERREVTFDVTDAEIKEVGKDALEAYSEEVVLDWISCRYGWGWSCSLLKNDFGSSEESDLSSLVITSEILNPRTKRILVTRKFGLGENVSQRRSHRWDA